MVNPKDLLMDDESLFKNERVFTPSYVPEDFAHRDSQLQEISYSLKPGLRGVNPVNTLVYGPPGTGKTTAVKIMFEQVAKTSQKLVTVYVNCMDHHTRFGVFSKIHEKVFGHSPPDTGKPLNAIKEKVYKKLEKEGKTLMVCLDEIDTLFLENAADNVLIDLLKAHTTYGFDKIGVIGILINREVMADLDEKVRSIYSPVEIHFPAYGEGEVEDILAKRAKYGFYEGVLTAEALSKIVSATMDRGDLRYGIELLRRSGLNAERDSSRKIMLKHVEDAAERDFNHRAEKVAEGLDEVGGKIIGFLEGGGLKSGDLYVMVRDATGVGVKKYNQIVKKLEHHGMIETNPVEGRGRSRMISLRK